MSDIMFIVYVCEGTDFPYRFHLVKFTVSPHIYKYKMALILDIMIALKNMNYRHCELALYCPSSHYFYVYICVRKHKLTQNRTLIGNKFVFTRPIWPTAAALCSNIITRTWLLTRHETVVALKRLMVQVVLLPRSMGTTGTWLDILRCSSSGAAQITGYD